MPEPTAGDHARPSAAVIYHFFAHYRAAVTECLARSASVRYAFYGDDHDYEGSIQPAELRPPVDFRLRRCIPLYRHIMWQRGLLGVALGREHDVLIFLANPYWPATWVTAALGRLRGKRILFWVHGLPADRRGRRARILRYFYRLAHGYLLYGHMAKQHGMACGISPERQHVVFNSLDVAAQRRAARDLPPDTVERVRTRLFGDAKRPMVICTTRLIAIRRLDLLIEALRILRADGIDCTLALVGDGPERGALERQAKEAGVPTAFTGALYDEVEIAPIMAAANVLVAPGKVGLAAMHSLGYGVPVVTHDDPADQMPEWEAIIPGVTGDLFRHGDVNDLARAIRPWLLLSERPDHVRKACLEMIDRFYNPWFQRAAIDRAVRGAPADDLFWLREGVPAQEAYT